MATETGARLATWRGAGGAHKHDAEVHATVQERGTLDQFVQSVRIGFVQGPGAQRSPARRMSSVCTKYSMRFDVSSSALIFKGESAGGPARNVLTRSA